MQKNGFSCFSINSIIGLRIPLLLSRQLQASRSGHCRGKISRRSMNVSWRCRARMICSCGRIGRPQICTRSSANRSLHYVQSSQITGSQLKDLPYSFRPTELPHGRWRSMSLARMRSNMALSKRKWARLISSGARRSEDDCAFAGANLAARPLPFPVPRLRITPNRELGA